MSFGVFSCLSMLVVNKLQVVKMFKACAKLEIFLAMYHYDLGLCGNNFIIFIGVQYSCYMCTMLYEVGYFTNRKNRQSIEIQL